MAAVIPISSAAGDSFEVDLEEFKESEERSLICGAYAAADRGWNRICQPDSAYGDEMPWAKTHELLRFRPHEVTAWIGPNGDGKSLLLGYLAGHWALQGKRVLVCSLEMDIGTQLARLSRQMLCTSAPEHGQYTRLMSRLTFNTELGNGWALAFFDYVGQMRLDRMLLLARYAARRMKIQHLVIDNITMICPPGRDSDERAAGFVAGCVQIARETGCHIHIVGHVRKPEDGRRLTRYDWRGTGACPDMVHNVVIVQGNEKKRRAVAENDYSMTEDPDCWICVDKQRNGEFNGRIGMWFRSAVLRLVQYGTDIPEAVAL